MAKRITEGDFSDVIGPKTEGSSKDQFDLGTKVFHGVFGELSIAAKSIEQRFAIIVQYSCNFILRAHDFRNADPNPGHRRRFGQLSGRALRQVPSSEVAHSRVPA